MTLYRIVNPGLLAATALFVATLLLPVLVQAAAGGGSVVSEPQTVDFILEKKFSGPVPEGYTADQFTFTVEGDGFSEQEVTLTHQTDDSADGSIELPAGTYTVTEHGPEGFVAEDWTIQWSGAGCENKNGPDLSTTILVTEDDLGLENFGCRADNQYFGDDFGGDDEVLGCTDPEAVNFDDEATEDDGSCEYEGDDATGTIIVEKEVTDGSSTTVAFSFSPSWGDDFALTDGQSTSSELATGTYSVSETVPSDWTQQSAVCVHGDQSTSSPSSIDLEEDETVTCTFTNDEDDDDDNGDNGGNGDKDKKLECDLSTTDKRVGKNDAFTLTWSSGGTVDRASLSPDVGSVSGNGSHTTTISSDTTFVLTVETLGDEEEVIATAICEAEVEVEKSSGGGGTRVDRSGGATRTGGSGGGNDDDGDPDGEVLGEQTDVIPLGAAATGAGGGAAQTAIPAFVLLAIAVAAGRRTLQSY